MIVWGVSKKSTVHQSSVLYHKTNNKLIRRESLLPSNVLELLLSLFTKAIVNLFVNINYLTLHCYLFSFPCSELIEFARKALISRVIELTDDRTALKLEVSTLQETTSRLESRIKEKEEDAKRHGRLFLHVNIVWKCYICYYGAINTTAVAITLFSMI